MRFPIPVSVPAFIFMGGVFGGISFAIAGAILGFGSLLHWLSGAALLYWFIRLAPKLFIVVSDDEGGE